MEIFWSDFAEDDLDAIFDYLVDDPEIAVRIVRGIRARADSLVDFPYMGGRGRFMGTRELLAERRYYIVYRVKGDNIEILNIIHTSQKYPPDSR